MIEWIFMFFGHDMWVGIHDWLRSPNDVPMMTMFFAGAFIGQLIFMRDNLRRLDDVKVDLEKDIDHYETLREMNQTY